jgi:uncharacterized membrane protein
MPEIRTPEKLVLWALVLALYVTVVLAEFTIVPVVGLAIIIMVTFVLVHGARFYGVRNIIIFAAITFIVSWCLESLSIATGFPFGNYHYTGAGKIGEVPWVIMPAYLSTGYLAWMIAHILTDHFGPTLKRKDVLLLPFIGAFVMVMWDLVMDPIHSTIRLEWIWENGGFYFGVPITNFIGWFLTVFLFFLLFSIYYHGWGSKGKQSEIRDRSFWLVVPMMYLGVAMESLLIPFVVILSPNITWSMSLITVFTMVFVTILAVIRVNEAHMTG